MDADLPARGAAPPAPPSRPPSPPPRSSTPPSPPARASARAPARPPVGQGAKAAVGSFGEQLVAHRLVEQGWTVLERNWRSRARDCPGELDIVALDPAGTLVVVEVRTRRGTACGTALESVTPPKLRRLRRLFGVWWAAQDPSSRGRHARGARIDVVAVQLEGSGPGRVTHVRGVG